MPTYEYACEACGHQWEAFQSMKDAPLRQCPSCKKRKAKRLVTGGTGFVLKGGGWYSDLYASSKPKTADSGSSDSTTSDTKGGDAKKDDAKPDKSSSDKKTKKKAASSSE